MDCRKGTYMIRGEIQDEDSMAEKLGNQQFDVIADFCAFTPKDVGRTFVCSGRGRNSISRPVRLLRIRNRRRITGSMKDAAGKSLLGIFPQQDRL